MNNKITVIIPTLGKTLPILEYQINILQMNDKVENIFIFDNSLGKVIEFCKNKPIKPLIPQHKLQIFDEENLYVNPAWNKGIALTKTFKLETLTGYYLLINDDVLCDNTDIDNCYNLLEKNECLNLVTINTINLQKPQAYEDLIKSYIDREIKIQNPIIDISYEQNVYFQGWFMFGRLKDWNPIPKSLKVFYGDNWIYLNLVKNNKKIAFIKNKEIYHIKSTTVNELKLDPQDELEEFKKQVAQNNLQI